MEVSLKTARKIGFFSALSVSLGAVIGIGIFFKNIGVINRQVGVDGGISFWSLVATWVLGALISLCTAYSFSEIATCRYSKNGLAGWAEQLSCPKQGLFVKVAHSGGYFAILAATLPLITVEGLIKAIVGEVHLGVVFTVGFVFLLLLSILNFYSVRGSSLFQLLGTIIKFFPIILVIFVGLIGPNNTHTINKTDTMNAKALTTNFFNVQGMLLALPSVLFSFDSFLAVGNIAKDVRKPQTVPLVALVSIIIASLAYILFAIASGLTGVGNASELLANGLSKNDKVKQAIDIFINVLVTFSAVFVLNSLSLCLLKSSEGLVEAKQIAFWPFFARFHKWGGFVLYWSWIIFYSLILVVPAIIMNNDAILDSSTNTPVSIFFLVYAYILALGIKDRYTKKQCKPVRGYVFSSVFAIVLILAVSVYTFLVQNLIDPIREQAYYFQTSEAGLFFKQGKGWYKGNDVVLFWVLVLWIVTFPIMNYFYLKKKQYG